MQVINAKSNVYNVKNNVSTIGIIQLLKYMFGVHLPKVKTSSQYWDVIIKIKSMLLALFS